MPTDIEEAAELFHAVDLFSGQMKRRLLEKARAGYVGWNNSEFTDFQIISKMHKDIISENPELKSVDIANRAMMLWYRNKSRR